MTSAINYSATGSSILKRIKCATGLQSELIPVVNGKYTKKILADDRKENFGRKVDNTRELWSVNREEDWIPLGDPLGDLTTTVPVPLTDNSSCKLKIRNSVTRRN